MHHDRGVFDAGWREQHDHGHGQGSGARQGHAADDVTDAKWVELRPTRSVRLRFYWSLFAGSVLLFFTLLIGGGHYGKSSGPHSVLGVLLFVACILIALAALGLAGSYGSSAGTSTTRTFMDVSAVEATRSTPA